MTPEQIERKRDAVRRHRARLKREGAPVVRIYLGRSYGIRAPLLGETPLSWEEIVIAVKHGFSTGRAS